MNKINLFTFNERKNNFRVSGKYETAAKQLDEKIDTISLH
jgi:hypothetical protein